MYIAYSKYCTYYTEYLLVTYKCTFEITCKQYIRLHKAPYNTYTYLFFAFLVHACVSACSKIESLPYYCYYQCTAHAYGNFPKVLIVFDKQHSGAVVSS